MRRLGWVMGVACALSIAACDEDDTRADGATRDAGTPTLPEGGIEAICARTCDAVANDDGTPLVAPPSAELPPGPVRMLAVVPATGMAYADVRSARIHLRGFGFDGDWVTDAELPAIDLSRYSAIAVLGSAWVPVDLGDAGAARLADAIDAGTDVLFMGPGLPSTLASRFGVRVAPDVTTGAIGVERIRFVGTGGRVVETPAFDEYVTALELDGATALATFEPGGPPAVTEYRPGNRFGRTVCIPFGLMHYWTESLDPDAWARAELLHDAFVMLQSRGAVMLAPFPDGHSSAFLVRFEDISPGGTRFNQHSDEYVGRFRRVIEQLDDLGIQAHLGLVAKYGDPSMAELFDWDDPGAGREALRSAIEWAIEEHGAQMISHGLTHQYGMGSNDYTGVDWEFSDDATGEWLFLPYDEQFIRIFAARETLIMQFGRTPRIWETPHLDGNEDTYRAAAEAGFDLINEGDGHLFPNRTGYAGLIDGHALNVPHTGSYVPLDDGEAYDYLAAASQFMMPRLARIGAPFFNFYHGYVPSQEEAMMTLAECAGACDLWTPTIGELGDWWVLRDATRIEGSIAPDRRALRASVREHPEGATLLFRLPDGAEVSAVRVDGAPAHYTAHREHGVRLVRVIVTPRTPAEVEVELAGPR